MRGHLSRLFASAWLVPVLTVAAIASLLVSTFVLVQFVRDQAEREQERIEADVETCDRANDLRAATRRVGDGAAELDARILDVILDEVDLDPANESRIRARFDDPIADYRRLIDSIKQVDCPAVTPGSTPGSTPTKETTP